MYMWTDYILWAMRHPCGTYESGQQLCALSGILESISAQQTTADGSGHFGHWSQPSQKWLGTPGLQHAWQLNRGARPQAARSVLQCLHLSSPHPWSPPLVHSRQRGLPAKPPTHGMSPKLCTPVDHRCLQGHTHRCHGATGWNSTTPAPVQPPPERVHGLHHDPP
jgi:hypothetical protein